MTRASRPLLSQHAFRFVADEVRRYLDLGWVPFPLCQPNAFGRCECDRPWHRGSEGKAPLFRDYTEFRVKAAGVSRYWTASGPNVGILLEPSSLVVLDLDGPAAIAEAEEYGWVDTATVETRQGLHLYYRYPESWPYRKAFPLTRQTQKGKSGKIDILSKGFVVAPPSLHRAQTVYCWSRIVPVVDPPAWVEKFLPLESWIVTDLSRRKYLNGTHNNDPALVREALSFLDPEAYDLWLKIGTALRSWDDYGDGQGQGFRHWEEWSRRSTKYPGTKALEMKWKVLVSGKVTMGTVYELASKEGFDRSRLKFSGRKLD